MASENETIALVTGGSGFIGSELIRQLNQKGVKVKALLRRTSPRDNLQGLDYEECIGDLQDYQSLIKAVEDVDYVFHVAGVVSATNKQEYFIHNERGCAHLAKACAEHSKKLKRFILVSSLAASGPSRNLSPRIETDIELPVSYYGQSKLAGEKQVLKYAEERFAVTIIRPPAVYGEKDKGFFELFKFVHHGIMPIFPSYNPTGKKYYSFVHVQDLVQGIIKAAFAKDQGRREIYFISDNKIYTSEELLSYIAQALGKNTVRVNIPSLILGLLAFIYTLLSKILKKNYPLTLDKLNELKPDFWICSADQAIKRLEFRPEFDLKTGIQKTAEWYLEHGWLKTKK